MKDYVKLENHECPKHGPVVIKTFLVGKDWMTGNCPQCNELKEQERQEREKLEALRKAKREAEVKQALIEKNFACSQIPLRFKSHSFESFIVDSEEKKRIKEQCCNYAINFAENLARGVSMTFCGSTGAGKTHLACAIANHVMREYSASALFMGTIDAIRRVKESYSKAAKQTEREVLESFVRVDLLILDEVGVQFGTETEQMILTEIINKRYENLKPTIVISNLGSQELKQKIGDRIVDRLRENGGKWLTFNWESYRKNFKN